MYNCFCYKNFKYTLSAILGVIIKKEVDEF